MPMATEGIAPRPHDMSNPLNHLCKPAAPSGAEDHKLNFTALPFRPQEPARTDETGGESSMYGDQDSRKRKQVCTDDEERKARRRASNRNSAKRMRQQRTQVLATLQQEVMQLRHMCQMLATENERCAQDCAEIEGHNQDIRSEISHLETLLSSSYDIPAYEARPSNDSYHRTRLTTEDPWNRNTTIRGTTTTRLMPGRATDITPAGIHSKVLTPDISHASPRPKLVAPPTLSHQAPISPHSHSQPQSFAHHPPVSPEISRPAVWPSMSTIKTPKTHNSLPPPSSITPPNPSPTFDFPTSAEEAYSPLCAFPQTQFARALKRPKLCASIVPPYSSTGLVSHLPDSHVRSPDSYGPTPAHHMSNMVSTTFPRLTSRGGSSTGSDSYTASSYSTYTMAGGSPGPVASPVSKPYDVRSTYGTHASSVQYRVTKPDPTVSRPPDSILSMRASQAGSNSLTPVKRPASVMDTSPLSSSMVPVSSAGGAHMGGVDGGHGGAAQVGLTGHSSWMQPASSVMSQQESPIESMLEQQAWYGRD